LSRHRQLDGFDNPAKAARRDGNLRVLREAGYRSLDSVAIMISEGNPQ